jgi:hypothetical protein
MFISTLFITIFIVALDILVIEWHSWSCWHGMIVGFISILLKCLHQIKRGRDRIAVGFTTIYAIGSYHH